MIVETDQPVTLLAAGTVESADLAAALRLAPILVAADGAAGMALAQGRMPQAVIGDLDSLDPAVAARIPPGALHRLEEQDSTDFDKCLRNIRAPLVLGLGLTGGRLDHELAALSVLARYRDRRCILIGATDLCLLTPPRLLLALPVATRVSLFPMARVTGRSRGLVWPIDGLVMEPAGTVGTSNAAADVAGPVEIACDAPGLLTILPKAHLTEAIRALNDAALWDG